jgi:hypothetical protein
MRDDDRRLEQHRHSPFAERRLEHHERRDGSGEPRRLPCTPGRKHKPEQHQPKRAGEIAVPHLFPGAHIVARLGYRPAVAERPVWTAQAGVGKPHVGADHHDDESERDRE